MFRTGSGLIDAEHAFTVARRQSRRAALARSLRRDRDGGRHLEVFGGVQSRRSGAAGAIHEIPLDADFRPVARSARKRWERVWLAEHRGTMLPPISVVRIGERYAVLDGHHRVSVARARGALTIDATVDAV